MSYPVAEVFHSIQGEGQWVGVPMYFVRLAGCNVGRDQVCTSCLGETFLCDTDYAKKLDMEPADILKGCTERRLCLTGGEPFLHDLRLLSSVVFARGKVLHIETNGTKLFPEWAVLEKRTEALRSEARRLWITCCPKLSFNYLNASHVDEWKLLVGPNTRLSELEAFVQGLPAYAPIYLQPINTPTEVDDQSVKRCLEILTVHQDWRLSAQLHKLLKVR